ncbi:MAG: biosynthetic-type acetolactate synthase large subunit [Acidobacteriota bacterium]|jgi:acetolactate synthase-1/2/3 large subunit|nr:biosynthetic-type acetolactate synthase large subunit [Acidobacteriota bacterium]
MTATLKEKIHPFAGRSMTGAEIVIETLAQEGVDTVFGYTGGAILPVYDALFRYNAERESRKNEQIRLVVPANEQGAGFMAAGYARASGKVGVFIVTSGPGATNSVTPIRDCMADSIPVVLITGQVARASIGTDAFQEAPVYNLMSACAKHVFLVERPEELEASVRTAFEIARSGRPGPVVVDVPKDVQNWEGVFTGSGTIRFRGYETRMKNLTEAALSENGCGEFFEMLRKSERPLICAGGGVIADNAAPQLREFSEKFGIPVVTTLMGIGAIDTQSDLSLHMLGMHGTAYANYAVMDCDFLIVIGARFEDRVAGKIHEFAPKAKYIAHIDIDAAEIGKVKGVSWAHIGSAREALTYLVSRKNDFNKSFEKWTAHIRHLKEQHGLNYDRGSRNIQPQHVLECLNEILKGDAIVCTGVGQHQMWAAQYLDFKEPRRFLTSGSMGTMGFGLPAAIGAQAAFPDKIVLDIDGDGSLRMNIGELETATSYNLPIKLLLLNNRADGMVRQWQKLFYEDRFSATDKTLRRKDFVRAAEADGFAFAARVEDKNLLEETLRKFIAFDGPAFLEIMIDRDAVVYPMVGPGLGYKDMMTGDFIQGRTTDDYAHEQIPTDAF